MILVSPDFMKSEVPLHLEYYFCDSNLGTIENLDLLPGNSNVRMLQKLL